MPQTRLDHTELRRRREPRATQGDGPVPINRQLSARGLLHVSTHTWRSTAASSEAAKSKLQGASTL